MLVTVEVVVIISLVVLLIGKVIPDTLDELVVIIVVSIEIGVVDKVLVADDYRNQTF